MSMKMAERLTRLNYEVARKLEEYEGAFCCSLQLIKHPETGGKIKIIIYPPYAQGMLKFSSLGEWVFKPFS